MTQVWVFLVFLELPPPNAKTTCGSRRAGGVSDSMSSVNGGLAAEVIPPGGLFVTGNKNKLLVDINLLNGSLAYPI